MGGHVFPIFGHCLCLRNLLNIIHIQTRSHSLHNLVAFEFPAMSLIDYYTIIRVVSAFLLVASCVLLKYTRTDDVN